MIIDAHVQIGVKKGYSISAAEILESMDKNKIDMSVIYSFSEMIDNNMVELAARKFPKRFIPYYVVNPWNPKAEIEVKEAFNNGIFKGLKLHPVLHGYALNNFEILGDIFVFCRDYKIPISSFGGANQFTIPNMFEEVAEVFPGITLIMEHGGQMYETKSAIGAIKRSKDLYIETSTMFSNRLENALIENLTHQLIFGSNTPLSDLRMELDKIHLLCKSKEQFERICSKNFIELYEKEGGIRL